MLVRNERRNSLNIETHAESGTKVMFIPDTFSTGAIKELLTHIVKGETPKSIVLLPKDKDDQEEIITSSDLQSLRKLPREDRLCELDTYAMRIKSSKTAAIVERE